MDSQLERMEKRLLRLERNNRNLKLGCVLAIITTAALVSMGAQQKAKRIIEADEFILRGPDGHARATLSADSTEGSLVFLDDSKKIKGIFAANRLVFSDLGGNARIAMRPDSDGGTLILGRHEDGEGLEFSNTSKEAGRYISKGEDLLSVSIQKSGNGIQDGPAIKLWDGLGFRTTIGHSEVLGKTTTSAVSLRIEGPSGKLIWSAP